MFVRNYQADKAKMKFCNSKKLDMFLTYDECRKNAIRTKAMYAEIYPERNQPSRALFERMCESLRPEVLTKLLLLLEILLRS